MKSIIRPDGLSRRTANCLTKAGIPIEKEAVIKALKNGTLYPCRNPHRYGITTHREVCRWAGVDASTLLAKEKVLFSWSGGKDSALCLHRLLESDRYEVVALLTTLNEHYHRVSMHGVREQLLDAQAHSIGLPLEKMFVSQISTTEEYAGKMREILLRYKAVGVGQVVFGDIFLEDLRRWRESNLAQVGLRGIFPLWKSDTRQLMTEFVRLGFHAVICCVNDAYLGEADVGRKLDAEFLKTLPPNVDPCGENGEYHSFAFEGPIFRKPIPIKVGEKVYRPIEQTHPTSTVSPSPDHPQTKGFWFCDVTLAEDAERSQ